MPAAPADRVPGSRRFLVASLLLGLFVLFDIGLLGWLIFRSLSQREIREVLGETRTEAEVLAEQLAGGASAAGDDLYTMVAVEREKQTYLDSILKNRAIVQNVEIRDKEGRLVFRAQSETFTPPQEESPAIESGERAPVVRVQETRRSYTPDMRLPIGELGFLYVGISQQELDRRVGLLREELVRQTMVIGSVTLAVLLAAYAIIWWQWRRGRRLQAQAAEAERMAYIGTLASGLAHEIRNPLNSLNLNIQLLEEEAGASLDGPSSQRLLDITQGEIGRLERLVTHFLLYAKPRPLELEAVKVGALIAHTRDLLRGEFAAAGGTLELDDRSGGASVRVDREQMSQLLVNLAQNALAASEGSGRAPRVVLGALRSGRDVVLEVTDNGVGIPEEEKAKIFDLFYSTRKGGTGLGLAVVQRIAKAHDGRLEIHSSPGSGTRVRLTLAAAPASAAAPAKVAVEEGAGA